MSVTRCCGAVTHANFDEEAMIKRDENHDLSTTEESHPRELFAIAEDRMRRGLAPPVEIYQIENRRRIDWSMFPAWAQPIDPEVFDGCSHEG